MKPAKKLDLDASAKTLRKLDAFGYKQNRTDFEWPTLEDLKKLPTDKPIKLVGFNWKLYDKDIGYKNVGAIQLLFANGINSPLFLSKNTDASNLLKVELDQSQPVTEIKGDINNENIRQVYFLSNDGKELAKIFAEKKVEPISVRLNQNEEIIGVFGNKDTYTYMQKLGFIVWTPTYI